jgi:hypothetical protein
MQGLDSKVKKFVEECVDCQAFTKKTTKQPIQPNRVPSSCWEEVSVDLFGPLPSKNHIVVVQDLASRYPVAKIVSSTSAKAVLPVLKQTYDMFGNPDVQKSDNGPPFNSKQMADFTTSRDIAQVKIPPGHPAPNNVETVMKPLGKAMKIGHANQIGERETLSSFLVNYRDTPHISTGVPPGAMLFRDGYKTTLPRKKVSNSNIIAARKKDAAVKEERKLVFNAARHTKEYILRVGDYVLVRNYKRQSKFDPDYLLDKFVVTNIASGNIVSLQNTENGSCLKRHPNDLKIFKGDVMYRNTNRRGDIEVVDNAGLWRDSFADIEKYNYQYASDDESDSC